MKVHVCIDRHDQSKGLLLSANTAKKSSHFFRVMFSEDICRRRTFAKKKGNQVALGWLRHVKIVQRNAVKAGNSDGCLVEQQ